MRIHPVKGAVAHGIAGDGVYVREVDGTDRQVHPGGGASGMPDWWGDLLIYVRNGEVWSSLADGTAAAQMRQNGQPVPANHVYACPTGWAAWTPDLGVRCSDGRTLPLAILLDVAWDGTVLVGDGYQTGVGLSAYQLGGGLLWNISNARPSTYWPYPQASCLDKDTACWTENGVLKGTIAMPPTLPLPWQVLHPTLSRVDGVLCVTYLRSSDDAVIGHPWVYQGVGTISTALPAYGPVGSGGTALTLHWSSGAGEKLNQIKSALPVPLSGFVPIDVPVPNPVGPPGKFTFTGAFFTNSVTPGNASIWVRGPLPVGKAVFAPIELADQVPAAYLAGLWVADERPSAGVVIPLDQRIAQSRPVAERLRVPLLVYDDQRTYRAAEIAQWCGTTPWLACPQWYIAAGENPDQFAADVCGQASRLAVPVMPALRCYTGGNTVPVAQVQAGLDAVAERMRVAGYFLFAWDRLDGVTGVPALAPWADMWLYAATSLSPGEARAWAGQQFPPPQPPPPVADAFGPVSDPLPIGTEIPDLAPFVTGAPSLWPRTGTHPMHQMVDVKADHTLIHHLKFDQTNFPNRDRYETWAVTNDFVHHIEDASNDQPYSMTDTRWFPRRMQIGQAYQFDDGGHEAIFKERGTCRETNRVYFRNRTWVLAAWDRFDCGPDLGVRRVVSMVFDPTDGAYAADRGIEIDYFAAGAGWLRWEYHRSDVVMASGVPVFNDASRVSRSDFYRLGGTAWTPRLTGCAPPPTVPPVVIPPPLPPVETPVTVDQIATVLAGCFFERISAHLSLNPAAPEAERRQSVHLWAIGTLIAIDEMYQGVFSRPLDLEGAGSRLLLYLDRPGFDDSDLLAILEDAKARGER